MGYDALSWFALGILVFVVLVMFYGVILLHDIPYEIAERRDHPHADAIHAAGWVSLFTLHAIWPFLWIWAMMWKKERGWGFSHRHDAEAKLALEERVAELERQLKEGGPWTS